jgi:ABC-type glycerol-3-phosphate transport system substrate-binding protein
MRKLAGALGAAALLAGAGLAQTAGPARAQDSTIRLVECRTKAGETIIIFVSGERAKEEARAFERQYEADTGEKVKCKV